MGDRGMKKYSEIETYEDIQRIIRKRGIIREHLIRVAWCFGGISVGMRVEGNWVIPFVIGLVLIIVGLILEYPDGF